MFFTRFNSVGNTESSKVDAFTIGCSTIVWSFTLGLTFCKAFNSGSKSFSVAFVLKIFYRCSIKTRNKRKKWSEFFCSCSKQNGKVLYDTTANSWACLVLHIDDPVLNSVCPRTSDFVYTQHNLTRVLKIRQDGIITRFTFIFSSIAKLTLPTQQKNL